MLVEMELQRVHQLATSAQMTRGVVQMAGSHTQADRT